MYKDKKEKKTMEKFYESPDVALVECLVEKGFSLSDDKYGDVDIDPTPGIPDWFGIDNLG